MTTDTKLFAGGCTNEKAHEWLQTVQLGWKWDAQKEEKLYRFGLSMAPGTEAATWWKGLKATEKDTWEKVVDEFQKKWPEPVAAKRDNGALRMDLAENTLPAELLGRQVHDEDGAPIQSHVLWAQRMRKIIADLGGDPSMLLLSDVRATLPLELRHYLNGMSLTTHDALFDAVEGLTADTLNDAHEMHERQTPKSPGRLADNLGAALSLSSPLRTSTLRSSRNSPALARTSQAAPVATPAPVTPQRRPAQGTWQQRALESDATLAGSTARPNAFTRGLMMQPPESPLANRSPRKPEPLSDTVKEVLRKIVAHPRTFDDTPIGRQQYDEAFAAWTAANVGLTNPDYTTLPFKPGTATLGSDECYNCGILTSPPHASRSCTRPPVSQAEQGIRVRVMQLVREERRRQENIFQVREVAPPDILGGLDWHSLDEELGNGEEPTV